MKRFFCGAVLALACLAGSAQAQTASWIFNPSYYSHDPINPVRVQRQYSRGPQFSPSAGQYVNSGYRYLRAQINVDGAIYDQWNMWDTWVQGGSKY
ncbi:MAG TPA: hypothetical protein VMF30_01875 [Pirellulales bacterium]|nr:hypothetical protein [Pirellulales bacterium]